ncbi:MAG: SPOR domain-containing protein [Bacteroidia bacterium]|nr:SPOR domain-containing protein [Bacteroidia bacterium]MCC6769252.1 SPOR domain-containing protein [Bacteroidia bacterium]
MKTLKFGLFAALCTLCTLSNGQTGKITYVEPAGLEQLLENYRKANYAAPGVDGFRVQVFSDAGNNAKERATSALKDFQDAFPGVPVYLTYQQPNFKVRAGDFRSKAEARKLQKTIHLQFPGSFIVKDFIQPLP